MKSIILLSLTALTFAISATAAPTPAPAEPTRAIEFTLQKVHTPGLADPFTSISTDCKMILDQLGPRVELTTAVGEISSFGAYSLRLQTRDLFIKTLQGAEKGKITSTPGGLDGPSTIYRVKYRLGDELHSFDLKSTGGTETQNDAREAQTLITFIDLHCKN